MAEPGLCTVSLGSDHFSDQKLSSEIVQNCPALCACTWRTLISLKLCINRFFKVELPVWQCGVGCNPRVCRGNSWCGSPFLTWAPDVGRDWELKQQFLFPHFSGRPHTSVIGASNLCLSAEPKGAFLWGLQALLPNLPPALFCLSCPIPLHSLPSVQAKPSLFLPCSLAEKPMFSWASLNGFSSLLPVFHLGLFIAITLPGLLFPACPSLWPFGCWQGCPLPWRSDSPGCLSPSHTSLTSCFLFAFPSSSLLVEFGVASLVTHLLSVSTFSCCSSAVDLFIVWDRLLYLIPCGLFLKQSSSTMLLMYPKVLQIFFLFHFIWEI